MFFLDGCGMYEATLNGRVLARSDSAVVVEGNVYFPPGSVKAKLLAPSRMRRRAMNAAGTHRHPSHLARRIENHGAFSGQVEVTRAERPSSR